MTTYNWQQPDWPDFQYDLTGIEKMLVTIAEKTGLISGKLAHLSKNLQTEALIDIMVEEAIKTSEIEGEHINQPDIRSSIKNKLGINKNIIRVHDRRAPGLVELMFDVRKTYKKNLTRTTLFNWHLMLLSSSYNPNIRIATWRIDNEPMQIVSRVRGTVHFEAPPAKSVPKEMEKFIRWFNATAPDGTKAIVFAPVRAAIAHLYFESIHPFDDGNGRIGRAIAEKALSQGFGYPAMLSLSQIIEANKKAYYNALHTASRSNEITPWIEYFVKVVLDAQLKVEEQINFILKKSKFFNKFENLLNDRQLKVVLRMFREGGTFEGGMSAKKYIAITNTSKATATRDLQDLLDLKAVTQIGEGRGVRYELNLD